MRPVRISRTSPWAVAGRLLLAVAWFLSGSHETGAWASEGDRDRAPEARPDVPEQLKEPGNGPVPNPARDPHQIARGRELFLREWVPNDERGHGGDGLGPVYNERSCVGCHHQGPTLGGGGAAGTNIEILTPAPSGATNGGPFTGAPGYYYAFSFNYGPGGFEYHIGDPAALNAAGARGKARARAPAPARPAAGRRPALAAAGRKGPDIAALVRIHPGFQNAPGVVLHRYGNDADYRVWREWALGQHGPIAMRSSQRNPTPLFGLGLIDAIPDDAIEAGARHRRPGTSSSVAGRVARLADGRIGRFGWKAQKATLREFVVEAAAVEMGLETPEHPQAADPRVPPIKAPGLDLDRDECDALTAFVGSLPRPIAAAAAGPREKRSRGAGRDIFRSIGCADCHVESLGGVHGIYSDLLLHAMSPELADTPSYGAFLAAADAPGGAGGNNHNKNNARAVPAGRRAGLKAGVVKEEEWRTPPLWGVRDSAPYLHDGRAGTIDEAIRLHGGEAAGAAHRYQQLSPRQRSELRAFLLSLAAPRVDET